MTRPEGGRVIDLAQARRLRRAWAPSARPIMTARLDGDAVLLTLESGARYRLDAAQVRIWRDAFAGLLVDMEGER